MSSCACNLAHDQCHFTSCPTCFSSLFTLKQILYIILFHLEILQNEALENKALSKWMDLETAIQSAVSQKEKNKCCILMHICRIWGLPRWLSGKEFACQCRRLRRFRFNPGSGRSPGVGNGNKLQYSCLENPMDGGAWWATVHGVTQNQT